MTETRDSAVWLETSTAAACGSSTMPVPPLPHPGSPTTPTTTRPVNGHNQSDGAGDTGGGITTANFPRSI